MPDRGPVAIADPRRFPDAGDGASPGAELHRWAQASLDAQTGQVAAACDGALRAALASMLARDGAQLAALIADAPSVPVARHLWRLLDAVAGTPSARNSGVAITLFALPVVVVAAIESGAEAVTLPAVLPRPDAVSAILREHGALAGNRAFALADALVGADAIDLARLPDLLVWRDLPDAAPDARADPPSLPPRALAPAPIALSPGREAVSLRFLVGTGLAGTAVDLVADARVGEWGIPLARELGAQIAGGRASVLALPRAPQRLLPAVHDGRTAQREVSAQLFVGNALRTLRSTVGEPVAVISAHRAPGVPGDGELRLSLSSPLAPRDAQGFRCPLYPLDRAPEVAGTLVALLDDCRVADIRVLAGVHPDRDPATGVPLLFKPDTIPASAALVH
jgi:hypothetical protein